MKKKIIAIILCLCSICMLFSGCGKSNETVYTRFKDFSDAKPFDFEINANIHSKSTEDANSSLKSDDTNTTIKSDETTPTMEKTEESSGAETSISDTEKSEIESTVGETTEETETKELVTTEALYNVRLLGTYITSENWSVKVFMKDENAKGYTNITNLIKVNDDLYVDIYSIIDSLDFLSDADGLIKSQFSIDKNYIKTTVEEFNQVIENEVKSKTLKPNDIVKHSFADLSSFFNKIPYDANVMDVLFDTVIDMMDSTATDIEESQNTEDNNTVFSSSSKEDGYTFEIKSDSPNAKAFFNNFGDLIENDLQGKVSEKITKLTEENGTKPSKKADPIDNSKIIKSLEAFNSTKDGWIYNFANELKNIDVKTEKFNFKATISSGDDISVEYTREKENSSQTITATLVISNPSSEEIKAPSNVIETKDTILSWYTNITSILESFINGNLDNEDKDLTPEKIVAIGKLIKPSQNNDFKYKIYDRYISISEYIGTSGTAVIPDTIEGLPVYVIEDSAFKDSPVLSSVKMTDNIIKIEQKAFSGCENLTTITFSKNLMDIPESMCNGCINLRNFEIPSSVKTIGTMAFAKCQAITYLVFPKSLSYVGDSAFMNCTALKGIVAVDGTVYDESGNYVKTTGLSIDKSAFAGCEELKTVILPDTIISIGKGAFEKYNDDSKEIMFYGYVPSPLSTYCATNKNLFTPISENGDIDKALKGTTKTAAEMLLSLT